MMLADAIVETYFGTAQKPAGWQIGLGRGVSEITDEGYSRQNVSRGGWQVFSGSVETGVMFGPFRQQVEFDTVLLFDQDGQVLDVAPIEAWRIPRNQTFHYTAVFRVRSM